MSESLSTATTPEELEQVQRRELTLRAEKEAIQARYVQHDEDSIWLEDSGGDVSEHGADEITPDIEWVYLNGQCLAMATALAKRLSGKVVVHTFEEDAEEWDDETDTPLMYENIRHAYALDENGGAWDVRGNNDLSALEVGEGERLLTLTPEEAQYRFEGFLSSQNYDAAVIFADMVIEAERVRS